MIISLNVQVAVAQRANAPNPNSVTKIVLKMAIVNIVHVVVMVIVLMILCAWVIRLLEITVSFQKNANPNSA